MKYADELNEEIDDALNRALRYRNKAERLEKENTALRAAHAETNTVLEATIARAERAEADDDLAHELLAVLRERSSMPHQHSDANMKHASEWLLSVARERLRHRNANS
jgi:beta-glucosidase-like glycosyl hydrolase